ncbi:ABC transporter ATP-binding protein [Granulosicoccus sp.]|nr:ABC transporter ATP-binding protein [Granulosicoccus sp.]MDB4223812.1 ABC transporter ATP-binding protein [Granulosicoccus sp.]
MTLLSTQGLSKQYSGLQAVNNVDFSLNAGEIRALIGPNGAGKSTFVGMLCGRIESTAGTVTFDGQNITGLPAHKRIELGMAYTFQITSVFLKLSVMENVSLAVRRLPDSSKALTRERVARALDRVNLLDRASTLAGDLSYGHQRLLEIAMGLGQEPRLFILDEPTQGLAESEIESFKALIKSMAGETTILLIEHNMDVVMETAERITVLNFGEVLAEGSPTEIRTNNTVQAAYLGTD